MAGSDEFDLTYATEQLRRRHHPLRRLIKEFYLRHILVDVRGPSIDFGCGAGQLLKRLPLGSVGIEINPILIGELRREGLDVIAYDASTDDFAFTGFAEHCFKTLIMSHVLEHFADSASVFRKICSASSRLGIETIILVVPTQTGYASDATHKTFVTAEYLQAHGLTQCENFQISKVHYFPGDRPSVGRYFVFHELKIVYRKVS